MMTRRLEAEFHRPMLNIYDAAAKLGYRPTRISCSMVNEHGGVAAAKRLLGAPEAQAGLTRLWELGLAGHLDGGAGGAGAVAAALQRCGAPGGAGSLERLWL